MHHLETSQNTVFDDMVQTKSVQQLCFYGQYLKGKMNTLHFNTS